MGLDVEWYYLHQNNNSTNRSSDFCKNIETLKVEASNCTECDLSKTRNNIVFGDGDPKADIMIIGEAPGKDEDDSGKPFIGRAGKLLDEILFSLHLDRKQIFITNTIKCRPPENRNPQKNEIDACDSLLKNQIDIIKPKVLVLLGRIAANTILNNDCSMNDLRKKMHTENLFQIPIYVLYHPAYLLRSPSQKKHLWEDLKILQNFIDNGYITH